MKHQESNLQIACVRWFRYQYPTLAPLLFAVPNGGKRTKKLVKTKAGYINTSVEGGIMKAEGVTAGVSDLLFLLPNTEHSALAIEMKTPTGRQSPAQKEWQKKVQEFGVKYVLIRHHDEFQKLITEYLSKTIFAKKKH